MIKNFILSAFLLLPWIVQAQVELKAGMKITRNTKFNKKFYQLSANSDVAIPLIEISGQNIVVDFNDLTLIGNKNGELPDAYHGLAIRISNGKNIVIKNLRARGFKIAVMAVNVKGLTISNCDLSYNYRQHLNSSQQKEDLSDWMSYHQNEKDEWLRYGAAIYLKDCSGADIHDNVVREGQCALMMTRCTKSLVHSNDFSFNSGIGIGLYRSSNNKIFFNKLDFNVRGHSFGVYNRGQDSAAILVFEQSNNNVFAYNSATHSGDGFFLWAGQTTMDSGRGGCNDNLVYWNDFSFAPTNGIEVTFSRNALEGNIIRGCDNGIWGGYSYDTKILNNEIIGNKTGIAIEHGQNNSFANNYFENNGTAIKLWSRNQQPSDWGYAKNRDTRSANYVFKQNIYAKNRVVYDIKKTDSIFMKNETYRVNELTWLKGDEVSHIDSSDFRQIIPFNIKYNLLEGIEFEKIPILPLRPGRDQIKMTEWGPYNYEYPLVWRTNPLDTSGLLKFQILGPAGSWKVKSSHGLKNMSGIEGNLPDSLTMELTGEGDGNYAIQLEYLGKGITDQLGHQTDAGKPFEFVYENPVVPLNWEVVWYGKDTAKLRGEHTRDLNYAWWGGILVNGVQIPEFQTKAISGVKLEGGKYELGVTWDDRARIWVDDRLVLEEWDASKYIFDESPNRKISLDLSPGWHTFRVEHEELGGFATIAVRLKKL